MTAAVETDREVTQEKVDACRARLKAVGHVVTQLRGDIDWLVRERAWAVLGYESFADMWRAENGFEMPFFVGVMVIDSLATEGIRSVGLSNSARRADGHTIGYLVRLVAIPRSSVCAVLAQLRHGVPCDHVVRHTEYHDVIAQHGTVPYEARKRPQPRRLGKTPDELVDESFGVRRSVADEIAEIARAADLPKAEIYRQAVAEYLMRHRESRPEATA